SLSGEPREDRYRVSIKREPHGAAGAYIDAQLQVDDILEGSAPRGNFMLRSTEGPVILLSAGVGATPVLAMLHALAAAASPKEVWWIYGARDGAEHPFAAETRSLLKALSRGRSYIRYSSPRREDRPCVDFAAPGRLDMPAIEALGLPRDGDFYLCGPSAFMNDLAVGLEAWGVAANRIHTEIFGSSPAGTPGIAASPQRTPHLPAGPGGTGPL